MKVNLFNTYSGNRVKSAAANLSDKANSQKLSFSSDSKRADYVVELVPRPQISSFVPELLEHGFRNLKTEGRVTGILNNDAKRGEETGTVAQFAYSRAYGTPMPNVKGLSQAELTTGLQSAINDSDMKTEMSTIFPTTSNPLSPALMQNAMFDVYYGRHDTSKVDGMLLQPVKSPGQVGERPLVNVLIEKVIPSTITALPGVDVLPRGERLQKLGSTLDTTDDVRTRAAQATDILSISESI